MADGLGMTALPEPLPKALARAPEARSEVVGRAVAVRASRAGRASRRAASRYSSPTASTAQAVDRDARGVAAQRRGAALRRHQARAGAKARAARSDRSRDFDGGRARRCSGTRWCCPTASAGVRRACASGHAMEFLKDQYRHCKPILVMGAAASLLDKAGIPRHCRSGDATPGCFVSPAGTIDAAHSGLCRGDCRSTGISQRETDPPVV